MPPKPTCNEHGRFCSSATIPLQGTLSAGSIHIHPSIHRTQSDHEVQALVVETGLQDNFRLHEDPEFPT